MTNTNLKPSIDWSHVAKGYRWMATDSSRVTWLYHRKPSLAGIAWVSARGDLYLNAEHFSSFKKGRGSWKNSLVERPKGDSILPQRVEGPLAGKSSGT